MALILRNGGSQSPDRWLKEPRNNHISLRESKYYDVEKGEFLFCFTENINKIKNRQEWFQSDLEEEYLHEIYPLYSPGEEDDEYEDEDGEKCSIMRNNV